MPIICGQLATSLGQLSVEKGVFLWGGKLADKDYHPFRALPGLHVSPASSAPNLTCSQIPFQFPECATLSLTSGHTLHPA